ncbi:C6 zinc finger domain protein [Aspergillus arachidicola]|uniref:C6 zinc finger domain protein n=1 Tax=Aspergillus arachidicola TaxID=656916 RepID=A0A2G7FH30_9EURO|nr:C6 zinc finger domain protein [Aspergillus arachidicola]
MASVSTIKGNVLPSPDLDVSVEVAATDQTADTPGLEVDIATPDKLATDDNARESPFGEGGALTPNSTTMSVSRTPGSDTGRRKDTARKPRRVRTGCLTCRERHLKCDEALHQCQNCRKSGRICRRGVRLNFIDTQTVAPPHYIPRPPGSRVTFRDESRHIASEYVGGFERYPPPVADPPLKADNLTSPPLPSTYHPHATPSFISGSGAQPASMNATFGSHPHPPYQPLQDQSASYAPFNSAGKGDVKTNNYTCLQDPDDVFLMQVFVEEVGQWMDSMNDVKHFTHILPFHALEQPMLLKAFMACGARHIYLKTPPTEKKKPYISMMQLPGISLARFMIQTEILLYVRQQLSCLHFNWALAWDPDTWGVNMDFEQDQPSVAGNEELWTHRMVYLCAKVANLRSSMSQLQPLDRSTNDMEISHRCQEWTMYNDWCDKWAKAVPRSMVPLAFLPSWQTNSKSSFPKIWLIKRASIIARLFYHTTRILLTKTHPLENEFSPEMQSVQQSHAHDICGIVANVKDRGVASLSIRFLAVAAECLATREAQEEVFGIFDDIAKETGWRSEQVKEGLQQAWGWNPAQQHQPVPTDPNALPLLNDHHTFDIDPTSTLLKMPRVTQMSTSTTQLQPPSPTYILRGHASPIHGLHIFHQNLRLISGDADGWIIVWDLVFKRPVAVWKAHEGAILEVKGFTFSNQTVTEVYTHGRDHKLCVWRFRAQDEDLLQKTLPVDMREQNQSQGTQPWLVHSLPVNALNFCAFSMLFLDKEESPVPREPEASDKTSTQSPGKNTQQHPSLFAVPNALNSGAIDIFHLPRERRLCTIPADPTTQTGMVMATLKELAVLKWHKEGCYTVAFADVEGSVDSGLRATEDGDGAEVTRPGEFSLATVQRQRNQKVQKTHWLAAGSKDGKISLWDIY